VERKTIELEQRLGIVWFVVCSYGAGGNRTLLDYFPSFELASQRFPQARLNGLACPEPVLAQNIVGRPS